MVPGASLMPVCETDRSRDIVMGLVGVLIRTGLCLMEVLTLTDQKCC